MKKRFSKTWILLSLLGIFPACIQEKIIDQPNQTQDVSFSFNIGDRGTKPIDDDVPEYEGENGCKEQEELQALATAGKLEANITISKNGIPLDPIKLIIKNLANNHLQTLAYPFAKGVYTIEAVTITSGDDVNPLFSGVKIGSKYEAYIPTNHHMGVAGFTIDESNKFKKIPIDLWVLCASKITPTDFGFIKWNINYIKAHCFAFMVNVCNPGDNSGTGELLIKYKVKGEENFTLLHQIAFNSDGKYGEFCFKDDYVVPDSLELYQLTLTIDGKEQTKYIPLDALKEYKSSPSWDNDKNFMHLNFCTCDTWIFDCSNGH